MTSYDNIRLEKGLYTTGKSFTEALESLDPSENYIGTSLEGLDAFQRQLKRFDIKVSGQNSDPIEKFFRTTDSAALFPEYIARAVKQGIEENDILSSIVAATTTIEGLDYRALAAVTDKSDDELMIVNEGTFIPETKIRTQENLIPLHKRGRMLTASYEAIRFQRLDIFTIALKQIGAAIARSQIKDAVDVLINGDGNGNEASVLTAQSSLTYDDAVNLWMSLHPYKMTTVLASPTALAEFLRLSEFKNSTSASDFDYSGKLITPFGAQLIRCDHMQNNSMIALDRNFALEKVQTGGITTEFDKLIDRQLERASVTATAGFAKIFKEASLVMEIA
ncbi:MAG: phage major capsid protein [Clostridia bacterium]|nr:phage major capsid protein [Clostridia bacterium]